LAFVDALTGRKGNPSSAVLPTITPGRPATFGLVDNFSKGPGAVLLISMAILTAAVAAEMA